MFAKRKIKEKIIIKVNWAWSKKHENQVILENEASRKEKEPPP